ncbi:protein-L-isoaspartate O-methyltransferase [Candidatus Acidianus copahuensis]|uniref:protein-L-isoaspartate(D-aspartate) O-methyltransferase n=2 Tax=Acidianus TaxID=12914 RepID=A0A031LM00_9CREN|nr:protein-L-isoaspartate O-methyltransferase [Candidatus Acidianus copahuensis]EZQ02256.1 protein-L-isoaspartate O-methyltransferase [Candidatus Acidianus copahuensis]NON63458.1 protein-L-isoaspartate O-methyltransferase [Acidianus sp. RZ1]
MKSLDELLKTLKTKELADAILKVNRADFLPDSMKQLATEEKYLESPIPITKQIATTALSLGVFMLDSLDLKRGDKVLEIGTGSGYYTALIAEVTGDENVVSIEYNEDMFEYAKMRLSKYPKIKLIKGDGTLGYPYESPYDKVIVWAACPTILCMPFSQMKEDGLMVIPVGCGKVQSLLLVRKNNNLPEIRKLSNVIFIKIGGVFGFYDQEN